jgi:hypothetical protein
MDLPARVGATGLLPAGAPVVVLLSGGRDSTCLLDVSLELCGRDAVRALHVDYGLRGEESDADAAHCAALCERLGVELIVERARRPPEGGGNLQAWARDVRYAAGARVAAAASGARLAAGHTVTDQVETILYRLAASPGRRALTGMAPAAGRLVRRRLAEDATGRLCPRAAGRLDDVLALRDGALDLGDGARAIVEDGVLHVGRTPPVEGAGGRGSSSLRDPMRDPEIGEILVQPDDLKQKVRELGERISQDYEGRDLLLVCVLKGAVFFLADLMRHIRIPCEVDFMAVAS